MVNPVPNHSYRLVREIQPGHNGYEIGFLQGASAILGHKVVEVLNDGVVIEDVAGVNQTRIPMYSIKSVVITKAGGVRQPLLFLHWISKNHAPECVLAIRRAGDTDAHLLVVAREDRLAVPR